MKLERIIETYHARGLSYDDINQLLDISKSDFQKFGRFAQRRLFREPIAYIQGSVNFFGREFKIDRRTYVPSIETEKMVKYLLEDLTENSTVLDVGTGAGNIAITVSKKSPTVKVYASDIDPTAMKVAKKNARIQ
jgi:release factor glutamine methyltransferase